MNKYHAKRTETDGIVFASQKEARRYSELKLLERAKQIENLILQPKYEFWHNDVRIGSYKPDFIYQENGRTVVEDVKGHRTREFIRQKKLMLAFYGIEILET